MRAVLPKIKAKYLWLLEGIGQNEGEEVSRLPEIEEEVPSEVCLEEADDSEGNNAFCPFVASLGRGLLPVKSKWNT